MKVDFSKTFNVFLVSFVILFWGCGEDSKSDTPPIEPPVTETGILTFSTTYDASEGTPMKVGYYIFDTAGQAVSYIGKGGNTQTLHWVDGSTLNKASTVKVEVPDDAVKGYTVVVLACPVGAKTGFEYNANARKLEDKMVVTPSEATGEYFTGRAVLDVNRNAQITLTRATGCIKVALNGSKIALDAVSSAEIILSGNSFTGGMLCDGTLAPSNSEGKILLTPDSWNCHVMPTVNKLVSSGTVRIYYRNAEDSELRVAEIPLENKHNFTLQSNMQTKLTITLQTDVDSNGELIPTLEVNTAWIDGSNLTTDNSNGIKDQFYYTLVKETVFKTNATNPTNAALAANATALATYGDYFYIPTGSWNPPTADRKLVVDIWSISQKKKVGTITTPQTAEGSFCYAIRSLYVSGGKLFVGHGLMETLPPYLAPIARVDIFDLAVTPQTPIFITSIGGDSYNPYIENSESNPLNDAKISEPLAIYEKDGKLLVLDHHRLNVFNSSDLTAGNSGKIKQTCILPKVVGVSLNAADFFTYNDELYVTNPSKESERGLCRVNWEAVKNSKGDQLVDAAPALLKGIPVTKIVAADDGYFVFSDVEKGIIQRFDKDWNFVTDCNTYFATVSNGTYQNATGKVTNAIPLPTPADKMPRLLMRDGSNVVIVRLERHYITEF